MVQKETIITPRQELSGLNPFLLWKHHHVLWHLISKDILVRYKQMFVGVFWVLLQPLIEVLAFTVVFSSVFETSSTLPYPIFVFVGVLIWTFFTSTIQRSSGCIVGHANLMKRLYFPKILLPLSVICARFIDFLITFAVFILMTIFYGIPLYTALFGVIPLIILLLAAMLGISLILCTAHVYYRDIGLVVPYILRIGMFVTPVFYPLEILPQKYHMIIALNPLTGIITAFRDIIAGQSLDITPLLITSIVTTTLLLFSGMITFSLAESNLLDEL